MKKILSLILVFAMMLSVFAAVPMNAGAVSTQLQQTSATSGDFTYYISDNTVCISKYSGSATSVVIPSEIDGYKVTSIGDYAFRECTSLKSVTIPDSVTSIGKSTFYECSNLKSVTIPDSVTSIADWTFSFCENLTSVTIPDSVTSIGEWAFQCCNSLTKVKLPEKLTTISKGAFNNSDGITEFVVPDSVTYIGDNAFFCCDSLTKVVLPAKLQYLGSCVLEYYYDTVYFKGTSKQWKNLTVKDRDRKDTMSGTWLDRVICMGNAPTVKVQNTNDGIKVEWNKISKVRREDKVYIDENRYYIADYTEDADNYIVYRRSLSSGKWSKWDAIKKTTKHSYVDKKAKAGIVYQYTVKAAYEDLRSAIKSSDDIRRLTTPTVKISNGEKGIIVKWNKVTKAANFEVYRRVKTSGKWSGWKKIAITKNRQYTDTKAVAGKEYRYTVKAINGDSKSTYTSTKTICRMETTKDVKASKVSGGIKVSWNKVSKIKGYQIQYSTSSKFTKSTTKSKTIANAKTTSTTISKLKGCGVSYYVRIRTYKTSNGKNEYSSWSKTKKITISEHKYKAATCTKAKTCTLCKKTSGKALGHKWSSATCTKPKTCTRCKKTSGKAAGHSFSNGYCTICNKKNPNYSSTGMVWIPTNGGKKYHSNAGCSNMNSPNQVTKSKAESYGFTPCKRCYK